MTFSRWIPVAVAVVWFAVCWNEDTPPGSPQFGDAFNVVAAVLASWAVLEAIKSTELQRKALEATQRALELQQKELEDTREVLDMQRQELAMQREAAEEQVVVSRVAVRLQRAAVNLDYVRAVQAKQDTKVGSQTREMVKRRLEEAARELAYIDRHQLLDSLGSADDESDRSDGVASSVPKGS